MSSLNRAAYSNSDRPTLDAFKESGGIEYGADVGAVLWTDPKSRKEDNQQQHLPEHQRQVSLFILKNRNGELAEIQMTFRPDVAKFTEVDRSRTEYVDSLRS